MGYAITGIDNTQRAQIFGDLTNNNKNGFSKRKIHLQRLKWTTYHIHVTDASAGAGTGTGTIAGTGADTVIVWLEFIADVHVS